MAQQNWHVRLANKLAAAVGNTAMLIAAMVLFLAQALSGQALAQPVVTKTVPFVNGFIGT